MRQDAGLSVTDGILVGNRAMARPHRLLATPRRSTASKRAAFPAERSKLRRRLSIGAKRRAANRKPLVRQAGDADGAFFTTGIDGRTRLANPRRLVLTREIGPDGVRFSGTISRREGRADAQELFTNERIAFALREAGNNTLVVESCRKIGVTEATFYGWKKVFAGKGVSEIQRLMWRDAQLRRRSAQHPVGFTGFHHVGESSRPTLLPI